jgi:Fic family protein
MTYTEIQKKGNNNYFYRVKSKRINGKVTKKKYYMGKELKGKELILKEKEADYGLGVLKYLLSQEQENTLKKLKNEYFKERNINFENKYESFVSLFTYDSNAIEGNTITLQETGQILFEGIAPAKSLREINEIKNHKRAFDFILNYNGKLDKKFILKLHKLVIENTLKIELDSQVGKYRTIQVYIRGVNWIPPKAKEIPNEMATLLRWHSKNNKVLHPLIVATYFHCGFELVHPFVDGNGRVGRLLVNYMLNKSGYPMINIPNSRKLEYYNSLEKGQVEGNLKPLLDFFYDIITNEKIKF